MVVDNLACLLKVKFDSYKGLGEYVKTAVSGKDIYLAKPLTFMNLSGKMIVHLAGFFKIKPSEILVCFDDLSLDLGHLRIKKDGSSGGQKGMRNIIELFGTDEIPRLRFGVGPKPDKFDAADFVLSKFPKKDDALLSETITKAAQAALDCVECGLDKAMNKYN